jgi:hypothetical protein
MNRDDIELTSFDLRHGMGIGGWNMVYCAHHKPTGCSITWSVSGSYPVSQHKMRERALMALELMVEVYD